ncbi:MAG: GGDEF domain-containing protein [Desulfarculaceae bacterium]|nr:GGDEF domain-containing protein [Desulfarculaceae bacterium]MCF8047219.1 GGDEF domain-containing protein [Desulfarculaceae bacterium]MCF8065376.1 GGDEF domain-containing protein [Desulfarculaceae bacterium]MCF8099042.1 GGDEF domain-containing protein [Desulfarculaceae bacterium]
MGVKHFGFKLAVGVLFVVVLASYGFYWLGISQLHDHVQQLVVVSNHLKYGESFHSAIHSMLLDSQGFYESKGQADYREAYLRHRAKAESSLAELRAHANSLPPDKTKKMVMERTEGIATAFAAYEKSLDRIIAGDFSRGRQCLINCTAQFDSIFKKYYVHLHDHHALLQTELSQSSSQTWHTMSVVFAVQLGLAVVAGLLVIFYLDRVVLKIFSFTEGMAYRDKLTGLQNRAALDKLTKSLDGDDNRPRRRYGLIMLDIDLFKDFNDTYGHPAGDALLSEFAKVIIENVRGPDRVVRYGGEEFLVVLQGVGREELSAVAEKLRTAIESHRFTLPDGKKAPQVTISLGAALYPQDGGDYHQVVGRADERLYEAKESGRNRVVGPPEIGSSGPGQGGPPTP